MLKINPVNTLDYMDHKPIEADYIASRYNEYLARAAHLYAKYTAGVFYFYRPADLNINDEWSCADSRANHFV